LIPALSLSLVPAAASVVKDDDKIPERVDAVEKDDNPKSELTQFLFVRVSPLAPEETVDQALAVVEIFPERRSKDIVAALLVELKMLFFKTI
jgi:hypothetical protein